MPNHRQVRIQSGFSLLEVLLAVTVMSSGLAGLAALMMAALGGTADAVRQGQATLLARSMIGSLQIAPGAPASFVSATTSSACSIGQTCAPDQFAATEISEWRSQIAARLPNGSGLVCRDSSPWDGSAAEPSCDGSGPLVVKVFWSGSLSTQPSENRQVQVLP